MIDNEYIPSNKFSGIAILYAIFVLTLTIPFLSLASAYSLFFIKPIILKAVITVLFGFLLGLVLVNIIYVGKIRNLLLSLIIGVLATVLFMYSQTCFYIPLTYQQVFTYEFPKDLFGPYPVNSDFDAVNQRIADEVNKYNSYLAKKDEILFTYTFNERLLISLKSFFNLNNTVNEIYRISQSGIEYDFGYRYSTILINVKGALLWLLWCFGCVIFYVTVFYKTKSKINSPFCEEENRWYKQKPKIELKNKGYHADLVEYLKNNDFYPLIHLDKFDKTDDMYGLKIVIYESPLQNYYLINIFKLSVTFKNELLRTDRNIQTERLTNYLPIKKETAVSLLKRFEQI